MHDQLNILKDTEDRIEVKLNSQINFILKTNVNHINKTRHYVVVVFLGAL